MLAAVRRSGGRVVSAADDQVLAAQEALAQRGLYVEPTSALPAAAADEWADDWLTDGASPTVMVLTGSGFKSPRR